MAASSAPFATVSPSRTATVLASPAISARAACHSIGSALPLVGIALTSFCRWTRAKLTLGGRLPRSTPQTAAATATSASAANSFLNSSLHFHLMFSCS